MLKITLKISNFTNVRFIEIKNNKIVSENEIINSSDRNNIKKIEN